MTRFLLIFCCFFAFSGKILAKDSYAIINNHDFYLLIDPESNETLLSKNANTRIAPSSMTKMMTAYVVLDQIKKGNLSPKKQCKISKEAWRTRGSTMFLNQGDRVSVKKLLEGLLIVSGNDAAIALANATAQSKENFVALMNFKARELGLTNSHFQNPHGLNEDGHYMSLRDIATLLSRLYRDFPEFNKISATKKFTYHKITQYNRNPLIKGKYDGLIGGKTGHTNDGGYGVAASVKRPGRHLIAVINKARTPKKRSQLIRSIFNFGFKKYKKITFFHKNQEIAALKTWLGAKNNVKAIAKQDISLNIPREISTNAIKVKINYLSPIKTPIKKGQKIADLTIEIENYTTKKYPLFAKESVKEGFLKRLFAK